MAASIVRLEGELTTARDKVLKLRRERAAQDRALDEIRAEVALLREEQRILQNTIEGLRDQLCADKCRDKAAADGGWANI